MNQFQAAYPELFSDETPLLTPDDMDHLASQLPETQASLEQRTNQHTLKAVGRHAITAMAWRRNPDSTIVIPRYFGGGIGPDVTWLADTIHSLDETDASIVVLPNSTPQHNHLHFTTEEHEQLKQGDATPYHERITDLLAATDLADSELHWLGASQGSLISLAVADYLKEQTGSLTLLDMPELSDSSSRNALNLIRSMKHYDTNQAMGSFGLEAPTDQSLQPGKTKGRGEITADMLALNSFMKVYDSDLAIASLATHRSRPISFVWGEQSRLSSDAKNQARATIAQTGGQTLKLSGDYADHSIAMTPPILAATVRRSMSLQDLIGRDSLVA